MNLIKHKSLKFRSITNAAELGSTILQNFYNAELNTNNEAYASIEQQIADEQLNQAGYALAAVANQDALDNNHQTYNTCMLRYKDTTQTFTTADSINLISLCTKCPYTDGFVVFRARALYNIMYHTIEAFSDECNTSNSSRFANKTTDEFEQQSFKIELYPNPTSDKFSIITDSEDAQLSIQILDVQGKLIFTDTMYVKNYETTVKADLANGVYIVNIANTSNGTKTIKKLVVQK